jgi:multisubunit Na+/H+ antiporter MnhG subunit
MITLYAAGVSSDSLKAFKAVVIIVIVVVSSPVVKNILGKTGSKRIALKSPAAVKKDR